MFLTKIRGIYHVIFTDASGKRLKRSTHARHKPEAEKFLASFNPSQIDTKTRLRVTLLSTFAKEYGEHHATIHTPKTQASYQSAFRELIRIVGDIPVSSVGVRMVGAFLAKKTQEASVWTARKYHISLASAFETAVRWDYAKTNVFRKVSRPKVVEKLPAFLEEDQFEAVLEAIPEQGFRDLVLVATLTGMRQSELLHLRWEDCDLLRRVILVQNTEGFTTKSKKNRLVPMHPRVFDALSRRKAASIGPLVFEQIRQDSVSKKFKKLIRRLKFDDRLHSHSLRSTFASHLAKRGVSLFAIQQLLGHSSPRVTQLYAHLCPSQLHDEVGVLFSTPKGKALKGGNNGTPDLQPVNVVRREELPSPTVVSEDLPS